MANISYDGQSFSINGRRIWLVSGAIHYTRTPHQLWRRRIRAAKQAGLNCIETYVFWNAHEPEPKHFAFEGDLDLRRFVQIIGEEGMFCILRPGPYICAEWDFGGLPPWLKCIKHPKTKRLVDVKLRQSDPYFLEATSRYLTAVMEQVKDLQITAPAGRLREVTPEGNTPGGAAGGFHRSMGAGPIILMQAENEWTCHNENEPYLREVVRYLRESGCNVPITNCNNLWQRVEGTLDTWNGSQHLAADMRQLAAVQPDAPRLVSEYWPGWFDHWGGPHADAVDADLNLYRLAGILSSGAQYNLYMFHGGTNFGFRGGRSVGDSPCYITTSYDYDAPLLEAGGRGDKYRATKLISTFASHFAGVFAHLDPVPTQAALALTEEDHPLSIVHLTGAQGEVVFLLKSKRDKTKQVDVMLPDGLTLPVPIGDARVAWFVRNVNLGGVAELNYTNLCPWAFMDRRMLVLFGPAGAEGLVSLDDAQYQVRVPGGAEPAVVQHDGVTLIVLNRKQVDAAYPFDGGLAVGCGGIDDDGQPVPLPDHANLRFISTAGKVTKPKATAAAKPTAPSISGWRYAALDAMLDGSDDAFQKIDGPAGFEQLGCDYGYGWYRIGVGASKSGKLLAPRSGDRLHVYIDGKLQSILGQGPGANHDPVQLKLAGGVVILADNLGRCNVGQRLGESKGLFGHVLRVRQMRLPKPKVTTGRGPDPFELEGYVAHRRKGERPTADALTWKIKPDGRKPVVLDIRAFPGEGVLMVNRQPFGLVTRPATRFVLTPGERGFTGGQNTVTFALYGRFDPKTNLAKHIKAYQATEIVTAKAAWSFAPWTVPEADAFDELPKTTVSQPAWFRGAFDVERADVPLWLEPRGMSKGQVYLNGHNVGRYWMATRTGRAVPPQQHYYLPEPWLHTDRPNELMLFDEHGKSPAKCRLVYNANGPYRK